MPTAFAAVLLATAVAACFVRLWLIWWQSICGGCGLEHKACSCPPADHLMRPRR